MTFDVTSINATNNGATSANSTFATTPAASGPPPYVGYVVIWGISDSGATVTWSSSVPATGRLAYGTTPALGQLTPIQPALLSSHGVTLTGLLSGTTYYVVGESTSAGGATGYSTVYSFTTH